MKTMDHLICIALVALFVAFEVALGYMGYFISGGPGGAFVGVFSGFFLFGIFAGVMNTLEERRKAAEKEVE